ncbi:hypothetical protein DFR27_0909 [Umboniibacter marinipuniceus]|uniref:Uncharacterized protein n=1 Tax=Umboniibacter marinipuniceus TaxID=569599 RepID=A0A3M0A7J2_9GAMM|nr:hypothetical protein DFR27_0909 [Umboniibacter marinipuniceus]
MNKGCPMGTFFLRAVSPRSHHKPQHATNAKLKTERYLEVRNQQPATSNQQSAISNQQSD